MLKKFYEFSHIELDPFGEEDWNDYIKNHSVFDIIWEISEKFDDNKKDEVKKIIEDCLINKTVNFTPSEHRYEQDYTENILVKGVEVVSNYPGVIDDIYLIDDENNKHGISLLRNSYLKVTE